MEQFDVFFIMILVVARYGEAGGAFWMIHHINDGLSFAVFIPSTFGLISRCGGPPKEILWEWLQVCVMHDLCLQFRNVHQWFA
jgi:hypothetical protein